MYRITSYHDHKNQFQWTPQKSHSLSQSAAVTSIQTTPTSTVTPPTSISETAYHTQSSNDRKAAKRPHPSELNEETTEEGSSAKKTKSLNVK